MGAGTGLAAAIMLIGLAFLVFFAFTAMKNARGLSSNPISNIINSLTKPLQQLQFTATGGSNLGAQGTGRGGITPANRPTGSSPMVQSTGGGSVTIKPKLQVSGSGQAMPGSQAGTTAPVKLKNKCEGKSIFQQAFNLC